MASKDDAAADTMADHADGTRRSGSSARICSSSDFVRHFVVLTSLAIGCIAGANYLINPLGLYAPTVFSPLVRTSRSDKLELLHHSSPSPEAVVLGSSRAMQVSPPLIQRLTGLPGFNLAVDSARTEDYYALVRWLVESEGAHPRLLLIGVDVEAFHDHAPPDDRLLALPALTTYLTGGDRRSALVMKLRQIVARQQTLLSARSLALQLRRTVSPQPLNKESDVFSHFEPDGYLRYDAWERRRARGQLRLDEQIQSSIDEYAMRFEGFTALSVERQVYFTSTLEYARAHGMDTIVFLTPLHPVLIASLRPLDYANRLREAQAFLSRETMAAGAVFHDFSSIENFNGDPRAFWDGAHVDEANADRMTMRLLDGYHAVQ